MHRASGYTVILISDAQQDKRRCCGTADETFFFNNPSGFSHTGSCLTDYKISCQNQKKKHSEYEIGTHNYNAVNKNKR